MLRLFAVPALGLLAACSLTNSPSDTDPNATAPGTDPPGGTTTTGTDTGTGGDDTIPPNCGNSVVDQDEDCDEGGVETAQCDIDCSFAECGDGRINRTAMEACDDGNTVSGDGCSSSCRPQAVELFATTIPAGTQDSFRFWIPPIVQMQPAVTMMGTGEDEQFWIAHSELTYTGTNIINAEGDLVLERFDRGGVALEEAPRMLTPANRDRAVTPRFAVNGDGVALVAFIAAGSGNDEQRLNYQILNADGSPGSGTEVNNTFNADLSPAVAARSDGGWCIAHRNSIGEDLFWNCVSEDGTAGTVVEIGPATADRSNSVHGAPHYNSSVVDIVPGYRGGLLAVYMANPALVIGVQFDADGDRVSSPTSFDIVDPFIGGEFGGALTTNGTDVTVLASGVRTNAAGNTVGQGLDILRVNQPNNSPPGQLPVDFVHESSSGEWANTYRPVRFGDQLAVAYTRLGEDAAGEAGCALALQRTDLFGVPSGEPVDIVPFTAQWCPRYASLAVNGRGDVMVAFTVWEATPRRASTQMLFLPEFFVSDAPD
ncbi:MAG: myxococcus cysteine-rich repeat containing protein [Myxococcota bacterium]